MTDDREKNGTEQRQPWIASQLTVLSAGDTAGGPILNTLETTGNYHS